MSPAAPDQSVHHRAPLRGTLAYGALFAVVLPVALAAWARRLDTFLPLPVAGPWWLGVALAIFGTGLMTAAMVGLWFEGGGLPMSPFPPLHLVVSGAYRVVTDPIYVGAVLLSAGVSMIAASPAGLWTVTPVLALAEAAFVLGYERDATRARFGSLPASWLRLHAPAGVPAIWAWCCRGAEAVANSWREWRVGPVRLMSHGIFAAAGSTAGVAVAVWLAGPTSLWWIVMVTLGAEVGSALWAQLVEGSPQLLRPYGYFGAVLAAASLCAVLGILGLDGWRLVSAMAVGGCITQVLGRLRCLVQGCCHGLPTERPWGIRYRHERSRVVRLSHLGGVLLHPTPVYSMFWTTLTFLVLVWLWARAVPLPFIAGSYLLLIGIGRFVEEHYRGEPQTAWLAGLRLYQWLAIAFVVVGAGLTALGGAPAPSPELPGLEALPALALVAAVTYMAFGVDFPAANRRFSRLV
jgi:prolipoprotein diacylglyceryltransferase/protein-S-isoprenylcysteine O-methyltransferase Ste14